MNTKDYDQKKQKCWDALHNELLKGEVQWQPVSRKEIFNFTFDRAYALGKQEKDAEEIQPPKFKRDDRVKTKYNDEYTVLGSEPIEDKYIYSLVCDNKSWGGMHLESKLRKVENK